MATNPFVIKSHDPDRTRLLWIGSVVALLVAGFFVYRIGQAKGGFDARKSKSEVRQLLAQNEHLSTANKKLKHEMAMLETGQTIDEASYENLKKTVKTLENDLSVQSKELRFYRQIMSPENKVEGLHTLNVQVTKIQDSEEYQLDMVVYQYHKIIRELKGEVIMTISGEQNGVPQNYAFQNLLSENSGQSPSFNFRYFQSYELRFVIPEGYVPSALKIQVVPATRGYKPIEETHQWSDLLMAKTAK